MQTILTITRYKPLFAFAGFFSMALFHIPFLFNRKRCFYKLMGSGRNGTFDKIPDLCQWAIITNIQDEYIGIQDDINTKKIYGNFISAWWRFWKCELLTIVLAPVEGHGTWDGETVFGRLNEQRVVNEPVAVLTRATIRLSRLKHFWSNVAPVASKMNGAEGFIFSVGIGELPWIKQATFSVWKSKEEMQQFAYRMHEHREVIQKTKKEEWYSEDMFVRFTIIAVSGTLRGCNPLKAIL